jgi:metal-responsive CopG/Arc/MetJ family transcriptional regulator
MIKLIQRVNVDFTATMLQELDGAAEELNVSRQAVIKTLLRHALYHHSGVWLGFSNGTTH